MMLRAAMLVVHSITCAVCAVSCTLTTYELLVVPLCSSSSSSVADDSAVLSAAGRRRASERLYSIY
jgi:hypothetical protein